jgi:prolyl-tRNA editing enzyme YbaK/EbsC (Cys-tRNA(Pro) deacylase)
MTIVFVGDGGIGCGGWGVGGNSLGQPAQARNLFGIKKLQVPLSVAEKATGFPTGASPLSVTLAAQDLRGTAMCAARAVWCGGGTRTRLVHLAVSDLLRSPAASLHITTADS